MTFQRVLDIWVGTGHPWRRWVKRPLFAALTVKEIVPDRTEIYSADSLRPGEAPAWLGDDKMAVVVDLPGRKALEMALALGARGYRPVLAINANSEAEEAIDMDPVLQLLVEGARFVASFSSGPDVCPVFILDSRREGKNRNLAPGRFDNRWTVFPSDLPSCDQLRDRGIRGVVIVQQKSRVLEESRVPVPPRPSHG